MLRKILNTQCFRPQQRMCRKRYEKLQEPSRVHTSLGALAHGHSNTVTAQSSKSAEAHRVILVVIFVFLLS